MSSANTQPNNPDEDKNSTDPSADSAKREGQDRKGNFRKSRPIDPMADAQRPLPSSMDAEKSVLSCMLQAPDICIGLAAEKLTPEHFHLPAHQILFDIITRQNDAQKPVDAVSLQQVLSDRKLMETVGGPGAVGEIFGFAPSPAHLEHYIDFVKKKSTLRRIITSSQECISRAFENQEEVEQLVDEVEEKIMKIRGDAETKGGIVPLNQRVMTAIEALERMRQNPDSLAGLATGFKDLDELTNGLHPGEMFIIAARPSMGKTSLVMNIVEHIAVDQKKPAAVFSLEMSADQLVQRLLCARAKIDMSSLRKGGTMSKADFLQITRAGSALGQATIIIDDTPSISIMDLRAKARRFKKTYDIQVIAIDYLQLMRSTSKRAQDNRQQEIAEISSGLKAIAKELKIPVVVLAQLNRNPEQRTGSNVGKPRLSDLRESGSIEQDADLVGLLYRPEYYAQDEEERQESAGEAELLIAKHRNGATGPIPLTFLNKYMRFESRAKEEA